MIDCVFLMLVYIMTTSSLEESEADLAFPAGQAGALADPLRAIDEQQLSIDSGGVLGWNGSRFDLQNVSDTGELEARLTAFRLTCGQAGSEASLQLLPGDKAPHQAVVTILDAITRSGIEAVHLP